MQRGRPSQASVLVAVEYKWKNGVEDTLLVIPIYDHDPKGIEFWLGAYSALHTLLLPFL